MTICERANDGLIRSIAEKFICQGKVEHDVELPAWFWWARGNANLKQNWNIGDFETTYHPTPYEKLDCRAYGVYFLRADIMKIVPQSDRTQQPAEQGRQHQRPSGSKIFIGHGRSPAWRDLKDFIVERLKLPYDEFNAESAAGIPNQHCTLSRC